MTEAPVKAAESTPRPWWDPSPERTHLVALALLVLITVPMLTKIFTSDFGTHIAKGRQIVTTRSIPDKEFLNYPRLGNPTDNYEWGFQAILYLVHSAGGVYAVSFLCWGVLFGIYYFLFRAMTLRGAHPLWAVLAIFAFSGFLRIRIQPRPEIFTYLFMALTIYVLSEYYYGTRKRLLWIMPPMMLFWVNMHSTYLMAFILSGAFFIDGLGRAFWGRRAGWPHLRTWVFPPLLVVAIGLLACGLNPYGYDTILAPLHLISRGGGQSQVLMSISELTPVKGTGFYIYYKAAVAFAIVSLFLGFLGRRIYLLDLILVAIAFKGGYDSARAVSMMGIFLAPGTSLHLTGFSEKLRQWFPGMRVDPAPERKKAEVRAKGKRREGPAIPARAGKTGGVAWHLPVRLAMAAALVGLGIIILSFSFSQLEFGIGKTEHKFSFAAVDFLRKNPVPGKMFNFFDIGGFLDWQLYPGALTFIDGRTNSGELFMEHQIVASGMSGWEGVIDKYGITYAVLKTMDSSGMMLPIVPVLSKAPNWTLVFADGLFVVFVRNDLPGVRQYALDHAISKMMLPQHIIWEAYHYMYLGVSPVVAYNTMANMYLVMGNRAKAAEVLRNAMREEDSPYLRERLMQIEGGGTPIRTEPK